MPINKLIAIIISSGLVVLAVIKAEFNLFNLLILQGSAFVLFLLVCLIVRIQSTYLIGLATCLLSASAILFLSGLHDLADLAATVAFKFILIALICIAAEYVRNPKAFSKNSDA